jgi:predicted Zn-dependent protease
MPQLLTREEAKALADRVLAMSTADQTRVFIVSTWSGNTRFADASITTSGGVTDTTLTITTAIGKRQASSSTNVLDEAALKRTVDLAIRLARLAPEDPELLPELGPQTYQTVSAFVESTADLDPEARASARPRPPPASRLARSSRRVSSKPMPVSSQSRRATACLPITAPLMRTTR